MTAQVTGHEGLESHFGPLICLATSNAGNVLDISANGDAVSVALTAPWDKQESPAGDLQQGNQWLSCFDSQDRLCPCVARG